MPGICFLRSPEERSASFEAWIDTTCFRDLQQIRGIRLSGELAKEILSALPRLHEPTIAETAAALRQDARKIKSHLDALESLFVVDRLEPYRLGVGKALYSVLDSGLAAHLGADFRTQLKTWALNECLAQHEALGQMLTIKHYRSAKHSRLDFVIEDKKGLRAFMISEDEAVGTYTLRTAAAFLKKVPAAKIIIVAPVREVYSESKNIKVVPWCAMG